MTWPAEATADEVRRGVDALVARPWADDDGAAEGGADDERTLGRVLFALAAIARAAGLDAEAALRREVRRFADRFDRWEDLARGRGVDPASLSAEERAALVRDAG